MCLRQSQLVYPGLNMSCWLALGLMVVLLQNGALLVVVRVFLQGGCFATCDTQQHSTLELGVSMRTHIHVYGHVQRLVVGQYTLKEASYG